jgi:hypothetical protein
VLLIIAKSEVHPGDITFGPAIGVPIRDVLGGTIARKNWKD